MSTSTSPRADGGTGAAAQGAVYNKQLTDYARYLGIDPEVDGALMWIAEQAMSAPVPGDWSVLEAPDGTPYYYNDATQESRWSHPHEDYFRELYWSLKQQQQPQGPIKATGKASRSGAKSPTATGDLQLDSPRRDRGDRMPSGASMSARVAKLEEEKRELVRHLDDAEEDLRVAKREEDRLQLIIRKLRDDRADLDISLREANRDLEKEVVLTRRLKKENDFLQRHIDEVEAANVSRGWATYLLEIEDALRACFSKDNSQGGDGDEWMVNVDQLHAMMEDLKAIQSSFQPYLPNQPGADAPTVPTRQPSFTGTASSDHPALQRKPSVASASVDLTNHIRKFSTENTSSLRIQLSQAEARVSELEDQLKALRKELEASEKKRAQDAAAIKDKLSAQSRRESGEAEELKAKLKTVQKEAEAASERASDAEASAKHLKEEIKRHESTIQDLRHKLLEANASTGARDAEQAAIHSAVEAEMERAKADAKAAREQVAQVEEKILKYKKRLMSMEASVKEADERTAQAKARADKSNDAMQQLNEEILNLKAKADAAERSALDARTRAQDGLARMEAQMQEAQTAFNATLESLRAKNRTLNERVLELQGNIRVLCRLRPLSRREAEATEASGGKPLEALIQYPEEGVLLFHDSKFEYDQVFSPSSTQDSVFREVQPAIWSAVNGYRVSIFAYGQTGSGKTFTMEGPPENRGVNLRAISEIFGQVASRQDVDYAVKLSMLEVYNETVQDLLGPPEAQRKGGLDIRVGAKGQVFVEGLTQCDVASVTDVEGLLALGSRNRHVGATNMNEHSSRSHLVVTITIQSTNKRSGAKAVGRLNLIDLAGSERLKTTGATGDRLEEAKNINKSLSALGDVIASMASASSHVPYRNSKLTFLLQDSLSANSKVLMFVNINPAPASAQESVCSLNFASRCRSVQLGQAKKGPSSQTARASTPSESKDTSSPR